MTRDSYAGEDDDPLSLHLYTYCGNDGVNNIDFDGHNPLALWSSTAWWLCAIDGPLPVGDVISLNRKINTNRFRELGFVVGIPRIFVNSGKLNYVYNVGARNISKAELDNRLEKLIKSESKSDGKGKSKEKSKKGKSKNGTRSKNSPARRVKLKSKKEAYQRAEKAGRGKEPIHHYNNGQSPHYHPNVKNSQRITSKEPCSHDHYIYPQ